MDGDGALSKIVEFYDFISKGKSQTVDSWFLMSSPTPMLSIFVFYLLFIYILGPFFMRNRKAYDLNNVTRAYNFFQIVACASIVAGFFTRGFTFDGVFDCSPAVTEEKKLKLLRVWWVVAMIRFVELIETVFFILRKKQRQASILHVYHHIGSIFGAWMSLKYDVNDRWVIHAVINCSVHVIMYVYYFWSSFSGFRSLSNRVKPYITILQIVQLLFIGVHSFYFSFASCGSKLFLTQAFNMLLLNYLFIRFYVRTYVKKKDQ